MQQIKHTNLHFELIKRGITQIEFAGLIYTTERSVRHWCDGISKPHRSTQTFIARIWEMGPVEVSNLFLTAKKK